jgi:hypothetical protein
MRYFRFVILFLALSTTLIFARPAFGYARITIVEAFAPEQGRVNEEIPLEAHVYTGNNVVEYVHNVQLTLLLPPNASIVSGDDPVFIGEMGPGPSFVRCRWTIELDEPGEYALLVNASCIDTQNMPQSMNATATIQVYDVPHAEFECDPALDVHVNDTVVFNATKSYPQGPGSTIVAYAWDYGDGTNSTTSLPTIEHKFSTMGNYTVTLNITDSREMSSLEVKEIAVSLLGDINLDGRVNILDISIVAKAFDSKLGDPSWNPSADVNRDELVNILDISLVAKEFGNSA